MLSTDAQIIIATVVGTSLAVGVALGVLIERWGARVQADTRRFQLEAAEDRRRFQLKVTKDRQFQNPQSVSERAANGATTTSRAAHRTVR